MSVMTSERLEAFSDGVIAIIITIMVLELEVPKEYTIEGLIEILPIFLSYFMSFLYVSVYWVSHHQLFKIAEKINAPTLWANLNFLFWLSLVPFTTDWIGEGNHHTDVIPIVTYGVILLMCHLSFLYLRGHIVKLHGKTSEVGLHLNKRTRGLIFTGIYTAGLLLSNINAFMAMGTFLLVGILKLIEMNAISKEV